MPHNLTQSELDSLSPEERQAVLEGEDEPAPEQNDEPDSHHSMGTGNPHSDTEEAAPAAAAPAKPATPAEAADDTPGDEPLLVPYQYDPGKFDMTAAEAAIADLDSKFQEGEIDLNEYNKQRDGIRESITTHKISAKISAEMGEQTAMAKWQANVEAFLAQDANQMYVNDKIKYVALNEVVKALARDPKNSNKSEPWLLKEADRQVRASMGSAAPASRQQTPVEKAVQARRPAAGLPPNLGDVPSAAPTSDDSGEFSGIDSLLDGTAEGQQRFERALAKMSREQQDRYLTT